MGKKWNKKQNVANMTDKLIKAYEVLIYAPKEKDMEKVSSSQGKIPSTKPAERLNTCRLLVELITSTEIM